MALSAEEFATFCKDKGFIYPSSEIYGGLAGLYDYGHLGTLLKRNFEQIWRRFFLGLHPNFFEIEAEIIMHEKVFRASGHLEHFNDPVVNCTKCAWSDRADHFVERHHKQRVEELTPQQLTEYIKQHNLTCPQCRSPLADVTMLNMMFPVTLGTGKTQTAYLRPETAQSPYINFKLQYELQRKKLPLGLAIIGRAFRNEISPRNLTLRLRALTQAELQIFFDPATIDTHPDFASIQDCALRTVMVEDRDTQMTVERTPQMLVDSGLPKFYVYHLAKIQQFYLDVLKIPPQKFRFYQLNDKEKAFYNKYHFDIEIEIENFGFVEVGGLHYRTDHDLTGHQEIAKQSMEVLDEASGRKFIPHVLELSFGVDRNLYAQLALNHEEDQQRGNIVLHLPPKVAPFLCAVFPLVKNKEELLHKAQSVYQLLREEFSCFYDITGSIGKRYARADEVGIPCCITIDFESTADDAVTVRDRESTTQERIPISRLKDYLREKLS